jgi:hypothetical protein
VSPTKAKDKKRHGYGRVTATWYFQYRFKLQHKAKKKSRITNSDFIQRRALIKDIPRSNKTVI